MSLSNTSHQGDCATSKGAPEASIAQAGSQAPSVSIGPNPSSNKVRVFSNANMANIAVVSALGRTLQRQQNSGTYTVLDVSTLAPGNYFVRIQFEDGSHTMQRLVKQ